MNYKCIYIFLYSCIVSSFIPWRDTNVFHVAEQNVTCFQASENHKPHFLFADVYTWMWHFITLSKGN